MKYPVVITSLTMRFYKFNGWTEEQLVPYLTGNVVLRGFGENEQDDQYWILDVDRRLNIKKMLEDEVIGELLCKDQYGELKGMTDEEVFNYRNW